MMEKLTTVTLFKFKKNKFWAFNQMGILPFKIKNIEGLSFFKLMGTGGRDGFSLTPDFETYAFLGVWESEYSEKSFFNKNKFIKKYLFKASEYRTIRMISIKSHGKWSGVNPFVEHKIKDKFKKLDVAVITRATLRFSRLISFWRSVPAASKAIKLAKGIIFYKGIGEWPFIQQATISIWDSFESVNNFAYNSKSHKKIVKKTRIQNWYSEDLFARFIVLSDSGFKPVI